MLEMVAYNILFSTLLFLILMPISPCFAFLQQQPRFIPLFGIEAL